MYKKLLLPLILLSFLITTKINVQALGISPPLLDYSLEKGQTVSGEVEVFNNDDTLSNYKFKVVNIDYEGDTATPVFDVNETPESGTLASWIKVAPQEASVSSLSKTIVEFTITVPKNAEEGTHTAILVVMDDSRRESGGNEVGVGKQLGLTFVITVKGKNTQEPNLKDFKLVNGVEIFGVRLFNTLPAEFKTRLSNNGNTYFTPQGKVVIRNSGRTKLIKDLVLNPNENRVLPGKTRLYTNLFLMDEESYYNYINNKGAKPFTRLKNYLNYTVKNLTIGKYNAELSVDTRINQQEPVVYSQQTNFIVFPYKPILLLAALYFVLAIPRKLINIYKGKRVLPS